MNEITKGIIEIQIRNKRLLLAKLNAIDKDLNEQYTKNLNERTELEQDIMDLEEDMK